MQTSNPILGRRILDAVLRAPIEPILHASPTRLRWLGFFILLGQPLFGWLWLTVVPQAFESMPLRLAIASLGLVFLCTRLARQPEARVTEWAFGLIVWVQLPLLFLWMYFHNPHSVVWSTSIGAMILLYYQLTDWRLASVGLLAALAVTALGQAWQGEPLPALGDVMNEGGFVFLFAWTAALFATLSAANQRRERLDHALTTMGIVAHELRTPLSALSLFGDALRDEVAQVSDPEQAERLEHIAWRVDALTRGMNQQIDMQIANSSLLRLSPSTQVLSAAAMVRSAVAQYPFGNHPENECVQVQLQGDFYFEGSKRLFVQVLFNLISNAFRALAARHGSAPNPEIRIQVSQSGAGGLIQVSDTGVGIEPRMLRRIFEPFFSTQSDAGHGLGLAFCRAVVLGAGGHIRVESKPGQGSTFFISLPAVPEPHAAVPVISQFSA